MATEVKIPSLGESITTGILSVWHVQSGDYVKQDQGIFELETDKITSEGTAEVDGIIELKVDEGTEVEIGSVVAVIDESAAPPEKEKTSDSADSKGAESTPDASIEKPSPDESAAESTPDESGPPEARQHPPSVRRIASESGVDPDTVSGTGKDGRVTKADMLDATTGKKQKDVERESRRKMTPLRKTISQRLVQAQQQMAMLTTFNEVDMSAVMNFRKRHQEDFVGRHGVKLGFMSFFTKAVVNALKEIPSVNARIEGDDIVSNHYYDIGIAVSTKKGLMVPVVKDCDNKSFAEIEKDIIAYATRAKEGKISIDDLSGGVFTITNGGIFGSMLSTPIVNYPQSAILGMHTIQDRPMAVDGEVVIRPVMYLALSYDHRLVDGREAVGFLVSIKKSIEDPARLLFDI